MSMIPLTLWLPGHHGRAQARRDSSGAGWTQASRGSAGAALFSQLKHAANQSLGFRRRRKAGLPELPTEVLEIIFALVDDPLQLQLTCKKFKLVTDGEVWRCKWLAEHYESYRIVFEAIARPKLCTPALVRQLKRSGAPLSENAFQLLYNSQVAIDHDSSTRFWGCPGENISWGLHVSIEAFDVFLAWASEFIRWILFNPNRLHGKIFQDWINQDHPTQKLSRQVLAMFQNGFMPLDLSYSSDAAQVLRRPESDITWAIRRCPQMIEPALASGYRLNSEIVEFLFDKWHEALPLELDTCEPFIQLLKVDGKLRVTSEWVIDTFFEADDVKDMVTDALENHFIPVPPPQNDEEAAERLDAQEEMDDLRLQLKVAKSKCDRLVLFDRAGELPFRLNDFGVGPLPPKAPPKPSPSPPASPVSAPCNESASAKTGGKRKADDLASDEEGSQVPKKVRSAK